MPFINLAPYVFTVFLLLIPSCLSQSRTLCPSQTCPKCPTLFLRSIVSQTLSFSDMSKMSNIILEINCFTHNHEYCSCASSLLAGVFPQSQHSQERIVNVTFIFSTSHEFIVQRPSWTFKYFNFHCNFTSSSRCIVTKVISDSFIRILIALNYCFKSN